MLKNRSLFWTGRLSWWLLLCAPSNQWWLRKSSTKRLTPNSFLSSLDRPSTKILSLSPSSKRLATMWETTSLQPISISGERTLGSWCSDLFRCLSVPSPSEWQSAFWLQYSWRTWDFWWRKRAFLKWLWLYFQGFSATSSANGRPFQESYRCSFAALLWPTTTSITWPRKEKLPLCTCWPI